MTTTTETPAEALACIQATVSKNDFAAIMQFAACGISPDDITPRVNVLTFKAWKALGRRVAKGATGQRVCVWVPVNDKETGKPDGVRPITAVLFHITQTIAEDAEKGTRPDAWSNPQLVKACTYDENGQVICKDAGEPLVTPTRESEEFEAAFENHTPTTVTPDHSAPADHEDSFTPEIITISSDKQWTEYLAEIAPEPAAPKAQQTDAAAEAKAFNRFARMMEPVWIEAAQAEAPAPKTKKQTSLF